MNYVYLIPPYNAGFTRSTKAENVTLPVYLAEWTFLKLTSRTSE